MLCGRKRKSSKDKAQFLIKNSSQNNPQDEPRIRFDRQNQNGGHTVWLYPAGGQEYFATRPQPTRYLYIQEIKFSEDQKVATVNVYRGDDSGYQGWQLTVTRQAGGQWVVTDEVELEAEPIK